MAQSPWTAAVHGGPVYSHPSQMWFAQEGFLSLTVIRAVAQMQVRGQSIRIEAISAEDPQGRRAERGAVQARAEQGTVQEEMGNGSYPKLPTRGDPMDSCPRWTGAVIWAWE